MDKNTTAVKKKPGRKGYSDMLKRVIRKAKRKEDGKGWCPAGVIAAYIERPYQYDDEEEDKAAGRQYYRIAGDEDSPTEILERMDAHIRSMTEGERRFCAAGMDALMRKAAGEAEGAKLTIADVLRCIADDPDPFIADYMKQYGLTPEKETIAYRRAWIDREYKRLFGDGEPGEVPPDASLWEIMRLNKKMTELQELIKQETERMNRADESLEKLKSGNDDLTEDEFEELSRFVDEVMAESSDEIEREEREKRKKREKRDKRVITPLTEEQRQCVSEAAALLARSEEAFGVSEDENDAGFWLDMDEERSVWFADVSVLLSDWAAWSREQPLKAISRRWVKEYCSLAGRLDDAFGTDAALLSREQRECLRGIADAAERMRELWLYA